MSNTQEITPKQYAWYVGCCVQNVHKNYRKTGLKNMPEILDVKHYSRFYVFVVPADWEIPTKDPMTRRR